MRMYCLRSDETIHILMMPRSRNKSVSKGSVISQRIVSRVGVARAPEVVDYPNPVDGFSPSTRYPEYPFRHLSSTTNSVYDLVRTAMYEAGWDREHYGTTQWNPLGAFIQPGFNVIIKPNWVSERNSSGDDVYAITTHASVVRAVGDYVLIANDFHPFLLQDAPIQGCRLNQVLKTNGYRDLTDFYNRELGMALECHDLRLVHRLSQNGVVDIERIESHPDYVAVNLGSQSFFQGHSCGLGYAVDLYDRRRMGCHHTPGHHEYLVHKSFLEADVVVTVPKFKTHQKVGLTVALKSAVGACGHKEWLPHYRVGSPDVGGDEYPNPSRLRRLARPLIDLADRTEHPHIRRFGSLFGMVLNQAGKRVSKDKTSGGAWIGNDTCWRMTLDLVRALLYSDSMGRLCDTPVRRLISISDGIISGDGNGPLSANSRPIGLITAACEWPAADAAHAAIMGFDLNKIRMLKNVFRRSECSLTSVAENDVRVGFKETSFGLDNLPREISLGFLPPPGWSELT